MARRGFREEKKQILGDITARIVRRETPSSGQTGEGDRERTSSADISRERGKGKRIDGSAMNSPMQDSHSLAEDAVRQFHFCWMDYALIGALLLVSILIGLYFGLCSKQNSTAEYLLGGRKMGYLPVATSIIASHISGITLLGVPSEVYRHGSQYAACAITAVLSCLITAYIFLPVFYKLQLTSVSEYLEMRFRGHVRTLSSVLFVTSLFLYVPIVVYVPALALAQTTGFGVHAIAPILCTVCIVYTTIGGLKAVVWTDTVQFTVTLGGLFAVLALGLASVGGIEKVWQVSEEGQRLVFFNMDPSPFARNTFWGMSIGLTVTWVGHLGIHQGAVQRFLSVPRETDARRAIAITAVGLIIVKLISVFTGLIMFTKYHDCDPLLTRAIERSDQTLPYYVMDVARGIPGLPGLFLVGLVSAALATMSASLNTMAGIVYQDFLAPWMKESKECGRSAIGEAGEARAASAMKGGRTAFAKLFRRLHPPHFQRIVLIGGLLSLALVFVVEHLGTVFRMALSLRGVTDGPALGLFVLGILVPWANATGALFGGIVGLLAMLLLVGGTEWYHRAAVGASRDVGLPTSVDGCPYPLNGTTPTTFLDLASQSEDDLPILFRISFVYYTAIGCAIVVLTGTLGSYLFGEVDLAELDPEYITPFLRRFLPRRKYAGVALNEVRKGTTILDKRGASEVLRGKEAVRPPLSL